MSLIVRESPILDRRDIGAHGLLNAWLIDQEIPHKFRQFANPSAQHIVHHQHLTGGHVASTNPNGCAF